MSPLSMPPVVATQEIASRPHPLAVVATDLEPVGAPAQVRAIDGDAAVVPPLDAVAGVTLEQEAVHLHDPVDALDVNRRATFIAAPASEQSVHPAIAVGRLTRDHLLDLGQQLGLGLGRSATPAGRNGRFGGEVRARHAEGVGDRLHGAPSRAGEGARNSRFFGCTRSSASRRISFSNVFLPNSRCSSLT